MLGIIRSLPDTLLEKFGVERHQISDVYLVETPGGKREVYLDTRGGKESPWSDENLRRIVPELRRLPITDEESGGSGGLITEKLGEVPIVTRTAWWAAVRRSGMLEIDWARIEPPLTEEDWHRLNEAERLGIISPAEIQFYNLRG